MTAHLHNHKITYFSVPKCACTSLKMMCFQLENGFAFRHFSANGRWFHIHRFLPSVPFEEASRGARRSSFRFSVIRSPKARIESCYKHWVGSDSGVNEMLKHRVAFEARGVPVTPTMEEFVEHLGAYREELPNIEHHTQPLSYFLGTDPDYYDDIYSLKRMPELLSVLKKRVGEQVAIQHQNESKASASYFPVSAQAEKKINDLYSEDFDLYERFFD